MSGSATSLMARRLCRSMLPCAAALALLTTASRASAQEQLCDNAFEDCRAIVISMIRAETAGLDVSMWFMTDTRYSS